MAIYFWPTALSRPARSDEHHFGYMHWEHTVSSFAAAVNCRIEGKAETKTTG
jgi:hypothetical protein